MRFPFGKKNCQKKICISKNFEYTNIVHEGSREHLSFVPIKEPIIHYWLFCFNWKFYYLFSNWNFKSWIDWIFDQAAFFNNIDVDCLLGIITLHKIHFLDINSTNVL